MEKLNIYFIVSHPIQYIVPLYARLSRREDVRLKVFFLSDETIKGGIDKQFGVEVKWDIPLLEGYDYQFIRNRSWKPSIFNKFWGVFNPGIISSLRNEPKGMVVISGWHYSTYILSFLVAAFLGHKVAIRCEAPAYKERNRRGFKNRMRGFFLNRILFRLLVHKCLYLGRENKEFYSYYGVQESNLHFTPYAIDNDRFRAATSLTGQMHERKKRGFRDDDFIVLFTGKFIPVKRPMDLIRAFNQMNVTEKKLVLVGDGMLKSEMENYIKEHHIQNIHFTGFVNQTELPAYYGMVDVLVLCSESETWGLSVNEGMACGLPVVVSDGVGCAKDLVKDGINGYIFPKRDIAALASCLEKIHSRVNAGEAMGKVSQRIIEDFSPDKSVDGIVSAARSVLHKENHKV